MLLAIDAGNTNTLFALHDGEKIRAQWRATTQDHRTADEHIAWLSQLMQLNHLTPCAIEAAIITTVVPQALFGLQKLCQHFLHCEPMVVGDPNITLGIEIRVEQPHEVGTDRLVNAVGAHHIYHHGADLTQTTATHARLSPSSNNTPFIIVDFGTATTFDVVATDGAYEGGIIAPGVNLSAEALYKAAARLPRVAVQKPNSILGKNTQSAMQSGLYWGYISLIEGLIARLKTQCEDPMQVIATGGLATLFEQGTQAIDIVDADLTIQGLVEIYQRNI